MSSVVVTAAFTCALFVGLMSMAAQESSPPAPVDELAAKSPLVEAASADGAVAQTPSATPTLPVAHPARGPPPQRSRTRILVLDIKSEGTAPEIARTVGRIVAARLEKRDGVDVIAADEIREMVDFEVQRINLGCDEQGCLAEIAGALGADVVFFGSVGALGDLLVLSLGGFDAHRVLALGRETVEVERLEDLPRRAGPAVDRLAARALGSALPPVKADPFGAPLFLVGAVTTAVGVLVGGGAAVAVALVLPDVSRSGASFSEVEEAKGAGRTATLIAIAGAVVAAVGVGCIVAAFTPVDEGAS